MISSYYCLSWKDKEKEGLLHTTLVKGTDDFQEYFNLKEFPGEKP